MEERHKAVLLPEWYDANPKIEEALEELLTFKKPLRKNVPIGYKRGVNINDKPVAVPIPDLLCSILKMLIEHRYLKTRSIRESLDLLNREIESYGTSKIGSIGSLSNLFTRYEIQLGLMREKDLPSTVKRELERKRLNEELRKSGKKRTVNRSREVKKKDEAMKKLKEARDEVKDLERKLHNAKRKAVSSARKVGTIKKPMQYNAWDIELIKSRIETVNRAVKKKVEETDVSVGLIRRYIRGLAEGWDEDVLMEMYKEIIRNKYKFEDRDILFLPSPRQYLFMASNEDIVLYGGAAGGGKSYAMVIDPLRYAHHKEHNAVIIRRTMPEANELIDTSREIYPIAFPGAKYRGDDHQWTFPSGAKIRFGYLDTPADKYKYQGKAFTYIGFDELSTHDTDEGFIYLMTRLRSASDLDDLVPYIRATANPGSQWVYDRFIKPNEPGQPFIMEGTENNKRPITMRFIPAKLEDNPYLDMDGHYRSMLEANPDEILRRQLLEGDWLASSDAMFPEFMPELHVTEPFFIPMHWNRVAGIDYGYRDPSAVVWFAVDPKTGALIVYDEFVQSGLTGRELALEIQERESNELVTVDHPVDWSIYARTGHTGPTIAESMLSVPNFRIRRADKNREAGWIQIHELLRCDSKTGAPRVQIFSSCTQLIKQLRSVKVHPTKPKDINDVRNSDGHWDLLDAFRYGVMARPRLQTFEQQMLRHKRESSWKRIDRYFS